MKEKQVYRSLVEHSRINPEYQEEVRRKKKI